MPKPTHTTLAAYAEQWLAQRELKARTREHYAKVLEQQIVPRLGRLPLRAITADDVPTWYAQFDPATPTIRALAYGLWRTILGTAASDGKINATPCVIRRAGSTRRAHKIRPATLVELAKLTDAMPEPYAPMILLASWCALRFGELIELRRADVDLVAGVIRVERYGARRGRLSGHHAEVRRGQPRRRDPAAPGAPAGRALIETRWH